MVSPRPSWVSVRPSMIVWPPSSRMPTSNDTRVRVDGFSKIIASVLPASGLYSPFGGAPFLYALPSARISRSVRVSKRSRSRKWRGVLPSLPGMSACLALRLLAAQVGAGRLDHGDRLGDVLRLDDERRQDAHHVVAGGGREQAARAERRTDLGVERLG